MQTKLTLVRGFDLLRLVDEEPSESFAALALRLEAALGGYGLKLENIVFHRFWTRDRLIRERVKDDRERLLGGARKSATSSFISASHILSGGAIRLEVIAFKPNNPATRRVVDFAPARSYAYYLAQDGWLFMSGMAEDGVTIDEQFDNAFMQLAAALEHEKKTWGTVTEANLFLERGSADIAWLKSRFTRAAPLLPRRVTFELVDGLASPGKKLEIEVIAAP